MICTVTLNPAVDHTIQLETFPEPDEVARTDTDRFDAGGKGINVAQYLHTLGVDTVATGLVGDFLGAYIERELDADGVANALVHIAGRTRLNTTITARHEEYKINHRGPRVDADSIDRIIGVLDEYDPQVVLVAGSLPPGLGSSDIDRIAAAGSWQTAVDVGGELLSQLDGEYLLCKPNREELAAATGAPVDSRADCIAAADALRAQGFRWVITSLGAEGALAIGDTERLYAAALAVEVADTVGAGDAMLAGVLAAFDAGDDARTALKQGIAVASRMVSVSGTRLESGDGIAFDADRVELTDLAAQP